MQHKPLNMDEKLRFRCEKGFRAKHPNAYDTLQKLAGIPGSKWTVELLDAARPAVGDPAADGAANVVQLTGEDYVRRVLFTRDETWASVDLRARPRPDRVCSHNPASNVRKRMRILCP